MTPETKAKLQEMVQKLAEHPAMPIPEVGVPARLESMLNGEEHRSYVALVGGTPRVALLPYEHYDMLIHLARLVTFEVTD